MWKRGGWRLGAEEVGHAWVVVFKDGKVYLLEATGKRRIQTMGTVSPRTIYLLPCF